MKEGSVVMLVLSMFGMLYLGMIAFSIVVNWKMLTKCGESGWKSLIPVYGSYVRACCATNDNRIRMGVLISNICVIVFSFGGMAFGMSSMFDVMMSFLRGMSASSSTINSGIVGELMMSLSILSAVVCFIMNCISEYMLGLTFDEDKSLGILMASPGMGLFASAFVVFDSDIEYGGALGEAYEADYDGEYDDDDYDDDEYEDDEE